MGSSSTLTRSWWRRAWWYPSYPKLDRCQSAWFRRPAKSSDDFGSPTASLLLSSTLRATFWSVLAGILGTQFQVSKNVQNLSAGPAWKTCCIKNMERQVKRRPKDQSPTSYLLLDVQSRVLSFVVFAWLDRIESRAHQQRRLFTAGGHFNNSSLFLGGNNNACG